MFRRSTRILLEIVIGLFAGIVILCGIAIWRLSTGPVALDFLTPHLQSAFNEPGGETSVEVGDTVLSWGDWPDSLDLRARTIKIRDREGFTLATLPSVRVKLSLRALLQGTVAPTLVEVFGAQLSLVRGTDGVIQLGDSTITSEDEESEGLAAALAQLLDTPDPGRPLAYLSTVRIIDAEISINDQKRLVIWQAPAADIELRREPDGLAGRLDLSVDLADRQLLVESSFRYLPADNRVSLDGRFEGFFPASLAEMVPEFAAFGGFQVPISGRLEAELSGQAELESLRFELLGGPGELALANVLGTPRPIEGLAVSGQFDGAARQLIFEGAEVRFKGSDGPGPILNLDGRAAQGDETFLVEVTAKLDGVQTDELGLYWPAPVAPNGRSWILENVRGGWAGNLDLDLALSLPREDPGAALVERVALTFSYRDLAVHFLRPMPPVTGISGTAAFDGKVMTFKPSSGRLDQVEVQPSVVKILGLDGDDHSMDIDVDLTGPLRSALTILDHERLKLIEPLGLDPADVTGQAVADLAFRFPLIKDLTFDDMEVTAQAELTGLSARDVLLGKDASEGTLSLDLTKAGMTVTGPLHLGGVPLTMVWREDFTGSVDPRRTFEAEVGRFEADERAAFKVDLRPFLDGPVSAKIVASFRRDETILVEAAANLQQAIVDFPFLKWKKIAGESGEVGFRLLLVDDQPRAIEAFDLRAGTLKAQGRAALDGSNVGFSSLDLDQLSYDRTRLEAVRVVRVGDGFEVAVGGGELDATVYLGGSEAVDGQAAQPQVTEPQTPLRLTASKLGALYFAEERYLEQVDLQMVRSTVGWEQVSMRGLVPQALRRTSQFSGSSSDNSTLTMDFRPDGAGRYDFSAETNDMGSVLNALNVLETVIGGELRITGKSDRTALDAPVRGQIEATGYELVNAPAMASMLTVASFTGILDLLKGEGIRFDRLTGDFSFWQNVLTTDLLRAYGPALGFTAKGDVDLRDDVIDLEGTAVPAYTINRVLGAIPVLGWILVGGEGEGLLAVTYRMKGPLEKPTVSVNPLAALAPGFLRGLFGFIGSGDDEALDTEPSLYPTNRGR